jgi:hypothetical protein
MPDINDPRVKTGSLVARELMTEYELLVAKANQFFCDWFALTLNTLVPNTADVVPDGRTDRPVTGADLTNVYNLAAAMVADMGIGGAMVKLQWVQKFSDANLGLIED